MAVNGRRASAILAQKHLHAASHLRGKFAARSEQAKSGFELEYPATSASSTRRDILPQLLARGEARLNRDGSCSSYPAPLFRSGGIRSESSVRRRRPVRGLIADGKRSVRLQMLISVTSPEQIVPIRPPPYFVSSNRRAA